MDLEKLKYLSNKELHEKLVELGFPTCKITDYTRGLFIEKLEELLEAKRKHTLKEMKDDEDIGLGKTSETKSRSCSTSITRSSLNVPSEKDCKNPSYVTTSMRKTNLIHLPKCNSGRKIQVLSIFFSFIFILIVCFTMYFGKFPAFFKEINEKKPTYTLCPDTMGPSYSKPCIQKELVNDALQMVKYILDTFAEILSGDVCEPSSVKPEFSLKALLNRWKLESNALPETIFAVEHLIKWNPQWNINIDRPHNDCESFESRDDECLDDFEETIVFSFNDTALQAKCKIKRKQKRFFLISGCFLVLGVTIVTLVVLFEHFRQTRKENSRIIAMFVDDIRNELLKSLGEELQTPGGSEMVLDHLRDKIVPPLPGPELLKLWEKAVTVLEQEEKFSTKFVIFNGEKFKTIKWAAGTKHEIEKNYSEKWKRPSLEKANSKIELPSSCVKVKNMIKNSDLENPNLKETIFKALIQRTANRAKINDIKIDRKSLNIYVRCVSAHDASVVYEEVNSAFYDDRPISVNFIQQKRYHRRFTHFSSKA